MNDPVTANVAGWQNELPDGLHLCRELVGSQAWEAVDDRFGVDRPIERVVRFFRIEDDWKPKVLSRLERLADPMLLHVETPLEAGWVAGGTVLYIVERTYRRTLETHLQEKGLDEHEAHAIFDALLAGVEELHGLRLVHGDLRPASILLRDDAREPEVCVGNAVTGPMPFWAGGTIVIDELHRYLPPEANGAVPAPSETADLYALGVIGCELFLGQRACQSLNSNPAALSHLLKQRGVSRRMRHLLGRLLDPAPARRPHQAGEVRRRLQLAVPVWLERTGLVIAVVLLLALSLHQGWSNRGLRAQLHVSTAQISDLSRQQKELQSSLAESEHRRQSEEERYREETERLRTGIHETQTRLDSAEQDLRTIRTVLADTTLSGEQLVSRIHQVIGHPNSPEQQLWSEFQKEQPPQWHTRPDALDAFNQWGSARRPVPADADLKKPRIWTRHIAAITEAQPSVELLEQYQQQPWSEAAQERQARLVWQQWNDSHRLSASERIAALRNTGWKLPPDHPVGRMLTAWQRQLAEVGMASTVWLTARTDDEIAADIRQRVREAVQTPWETEHREETVRFCDAADRAAAIWNQYAHKEELTWDQFESRVRNAVAAGPEDLRPGVEAILQRWHAAYEARSGEVWKLQLVKAAVTPPKGESETPDYGVARLLNLYSGDEHLEVKHSWSSPTSHQYAGSENSAGSEHEFVEFHWKVGEPVQLLLEIDGWTVNTNLLDGIFRGPVAVWRVHTGRRISNSGTGTSMDFRIVDCPGPPEEVVEKVTNMLDGKSGS